MIAVISIHALAKLVHRHVAHNLRKVGGGYKSTVVNLNR